MSVSARRKLTAGEYLAIERSAAFKSEFINGEMFAMAGAGYPHNRIRENLSIEIGSRLKGGPCQTLSSDQRVKVSRTGLYTYPDLLIVCGLPELDSEDGLSLTNPQIIFEVVSESTESYDRGVKFLHYRQLPAFREYVLVSQQQKLIERFVRQADDDWLLTTFAAPEGDVSLATLSVRVPMAEVYRGVDLPDFPLAGPASK